MKTTPNTPDTTAERQDFDKQVRSIQKAYEHRRAQLEASLSALDAAHDEWLALGDGPKWIRLKVLAALQKRGQVASVYSEQVKSSAVDLIAELDREADEATKRLKERLGR